jgi:hypothetical protein
MKAPNLFLKFFSVRLFSVCLMTVMIAVSATSVFAKPISFADGTTFMHERDRNMLETNLFYAPKVWVSLGGSASFMQSDDKTKRHDAAYAQINFLVKRWNMPNAQANLFVSGGLGEANVREQHVTGNIDERVTARRIAMQGDYETRQFYTSLKIDTQASSRYFDRFDTFQIGFSPVAHDYDDLAVWFIAQVKKSRGMDDKTEGGAFLRLFKGNIWVELGMNERRKSQMMLMINY